MFHRRLESQTCTDGALKHCWVLLLTFGVWLIGLTPALAAPPAFLAFESGPVRPLALSPSGNFLYAVNTPDGQLEIYAVNAIGIEFSHSVPVGQEPVSVAARSDSEVWVVNHLSDSVSIVDPIARRVTRTLLTGDEPRDIVFAGPGNVRAFITTAHRGQHRTDLSIAAVPGAGDPQLTTPGIGRADVWVFDATALGNTMGGTPLRIVTVFGDTPRALERSADGTKVWVAVHHSGNRTTTLNEAFVCDGFGAALTGCNPVAGTSLSAPGGLLGPSANFAGDPAPEVGLIVQQGAGGLWRDRSGRVWDTGLGIGSFIRFNLPDLDVFEINTTTLTQSASHASVGTTLFNMTVHPTNGKLYVSNTDAQNLTSFEGSGISGGSTVQGHLAESRITVIDGASVRPRHLNKHINYSQLAGDPGFDPSAKEHSLATPLEMAVSADGATLYVAAFGSGQIGVFPTAALEDDSFDPTLTSANYIDVSGGGPAGLVLDEANDRMFVYTRWDNGISTIDLTSGIEVEHVSFANQEPPEVVIGRRFLYDAKFSSANGEASCGACHPFGGADHLAWDLGNPDDIVTSNPMSILFPPDPVPPNLNGSGFVDEFHPMKGPMTTQTMHGMQHGGAMHWRGDRSNGELGLSPDDEDLSFRNFIVAFEGLLGRETPFPEPEMEQFADYALALVLPPNPVRPLDNQLAPNVAAAREFYFNTATDGPLTCEQCHILDASRGFFGTGAFATGEGSTQIVKVPHLRNAYEKVGMFGFLAGFGEGIGHTGDQIRGFGYLKDGSIDTLFRFVSASAFSFPSEAARRDQEQFMLQFDHDLAPIVAQQVTLDATNGPVVGPRIDLLIARASAPFTSLLLGGVTTECELIVKGTVGGAPHGWARLSGGLFQRDDDPSQSALIDDPTLRALAISEGPLTYTCVAPGSGVRAGIDRDLDAVLDALDNCPGHDNLDQLDDDGDGIGNVCDPTPVPEPEMMAGLFFGGLMLFILVSARRRERAFRV